MLLPLVFSSLHLIILPSAQWYVCEMMKVIPKVEP